MSQSYPSFESAKEMASFEKIDSFAIIFRIQHSGSHGVVWWDSKAEKVMAHRIWWSGK